MQTTLLGGDAVLCWMDVLLFLRTGLEVVWAKGFLQVLVKGRMVLSLGLQELLWHPVGWGQGVCSLHSSWLESCADSCWKWWVCRICEQLITSLLFVTELSQQLGRELLPAVSTVPVGACRASHPYSSQPGTCALPVPEP